ncbi:MAG TPA: glycosyltransferase, partial [Caldimonas sp.]|nr:glycosyltransferase [Caldimonas sp.]
MRRVLLIAYYFPPQPKAGALRPSYLAEHLPTFGWQPTVLTVEFPGDRPAGVDVISVRPLGARSGANATQSAEPPSPRRRSDSERRLRALARTIVFFPDDQVVWQLPARAAALRLTASQQFDAVLSTAPPISSHFVARAVAKARALPWIADYRDLWAGPAGPYFDREFGPIKRSIAYASERWLLRPAAALTAPTDGHAKALAEYFARPDAEMIPNASDMSIWDKIVAPDPKEFRFCYAGKLYPRLRTPDVVFSAIAKLRAAGDPAGLAARFDFYGEDPHLVAESARTYGLTDVVTIHGEVPRRDALAAQRGSAVLLLLLNTAGDVDHIEIVNPGSKILEYAGARRPILAVGSRNNSMETTVRETGLGLFASDDETCAQAIRKLHADFS